MANLPLRPPAPFAKAVASLDVLSGGRVELGLGAGAFWDGVAGLGGPRRAPGESVDALEEAIEVIRLMWAGEPASFEGRFYSLEGAKPGPVPAHDVAIWIGAYRPRMLRLTGRVADGWLPSLPRLSPEDLPERVRLLEEGAEAAGRDAASVRRLANVTGVITDGPTEGFLRGPTDHWVEELQRLHRDFGFSAFVFSPDGDDPEQVERFASEVAPAVREAA